MKKSLVHKKMAAEQGDQSGVAVLDVKSHRYEAFDNVSTLVISYL